MNKNQDWIEMMRNLEDLLGTVKMTDREREKILDLFINYERNHPGSIDIESFKSFGEKLYKYIGNLSGPKRKTRKEAEDDLEDLKKQVYRDEGKKGVYFREEKVEENEDGTFQAYLESAYSGR
jgi:hypothetical protein